MCTPREDTLSSPGVLENVGKNVHKLFTVELSDNTESAPVIDALSRIVFIEFVRLGGQNLVENKLSFGKFKGSGTRSSNSDHCCINSRNIAYGNL